MSDVPGEPSADRTLRRLRRVMALCTGGLVAATWPLWLPDPGFPQIPWFGWVVRLPRGPGEIVLVGNLAVFLLLQFLEIRRRWLRWGLNGFFFLTSVPLLLLLDQHRLQPWVWQMLLGAGIIGLACTSGQALGRLRWLTISIYVWSAVSKFDRAFLEGHGQVLLEGLTDAVGLSSALWSPALRQALAAAMPIGELVTAILLMRTRTRRIGLWSAVAMHVAIMLALGPTGLGHELGVLIWNAFFVVNVWLLFGEPRTSVGEGEPQTSVWARSSSEQLAHAPGRLGRLPGGLCRVIVGWGPRLTSGARQGSGACRVGGVFTWLVCLLPALSLAGWWDWWPSWAVYSSRPAIVQMLVHHTDVEKLPDPLRPYVGPAPPLSDWRPVNLDAFSYATCRCPMYPQQRYRLAVIAAFAGRAQIEPWIEIRSSPVRWTGHRRRQRLSADELAGRLRSFWWNTAARRR